MRRLLVAFLTLVLGLGVAHPGFAGPPDCAIDNGDTNGDQSRDLSDAIYLLSHLFQGGPAPALFCTAAGTEAGCAEVNGDNNGDQSRDLSDTIYLLAFLFQGGPGPVPKCQAGPETEINCTDNIDDDLDGDTDCDDCDCAGEPSCPENSPSRLPRTSTKEVLCFDDSVPAVEIPCTDATCPGQDGFFDLNGCMNNPRFIDNADATVTDSCTGLMWQKNSGNGGAGLPWCDALGYCEDINFATHTDWRLPNIRELESIVDYGNGPAFDTTAFPNHSNAHWSSTTVTDSAANAWYVDFSGGQVFRNSGKHNANRVRAVRGTSNLPATGQALCYDGIGEVISCTDDAASCFGQDGFYSLGCSISCRFTDNLDETVTDTCTGLMWQKDTGNGGTPTGWCGALAYCEGLSLAGQGDWRLPNPRELHSLVDYGRQGPALDPIFNTTEGTLSWASMSQIMNEVSGWYVDFQGGHSNTSRKANFHQVRAVRCEGPGVCPELVCTGGVDEDGDGLTDTDDPDCAEMICNDALDNDQDGVTDCDDPDCATSGACEVICDDNVDNDLDGLTDCVDSNCILDAACQVDPSPLPDTSTSLNSTKCYDEAGAEIACTDATCPGQDGFYTGGCLEDPRFTNNLDGTVTDACTGLMWQQSTGNGGAGLPWCNGLAYCEELSLAGQSDWRLPNIRELESIVDYVRGPAIDTAIFSGGASAHWSSTSVADPGPGPRAWYINFSGGEVSGSQKFNANLVRAVRGISDLLLPDTGQKLCYDEEGGVISCTDDSAPCFGQDGFYATGCANTPRFTDNLDGTVTDTCTGLMWQQDTGNEGAGLPWCNALAYCEELNFAGHTNWRLPDARELHSLIDYGQHSPALDPLFSTVVGQGSWASTSQTGNFNRAWLFGLNIGSPFSGGPSTVSLKGTLINVRAVRDAP